MSTVVLSNELHVEVKPRARVEVCEGHLPGENGVSIGRSRIGAPSRMGLSCPEDRIFFALNGETRIDRRIADRRLVHRLRPGSMALLPAGANAAAEVEPSRS